MEIRIEKKEKVPVYPDDFSSFKDGVDISNEEINSWIEKGILNLEWEGNIGDSYSISSGNSLVVIHKYEDEYRIVVTKDYSNAEIFI